MPFFQSSTAADAEPVTLHYVDHGRGAPIVLIHGWPFSHRMWEYQFESLVSSGHRVVAYTRRGFGESDKPWHGYDYDTLTEDLRSLLTTLDLDEVTLVGFSMGGGEVARYFGRYGSDRVARAVLVSSVTPYLPRTDDNPDGVPSETFDEMVAGLADDRPDFLAGFVRDLYGVYDGNDAVSPERLAHAQALALQASGRATRECVKAFASTDFRDDVTKIDVPALVVHGGADRVVPIETSGDVVATTIADVRYVPVEGAPHGLVHTHQDLVNGLLVDFLRV